MHCCNYPVVYSTVYLIKYFSLTAFLQCNVTVVIIYLCCMDGPNIPHAISAFIFSEKHLFLSEQRDCTMCTLYHCSMKKKIDDKCPSLKQTSMDKMNVQKAHCVNNNNTLCYYSNTLCHNEELTFTWGICQKSFFKFIQVEFSVQHK